MTITIHLEDGLAEALRREASAERVPPEELGRRLIQDALEQRSAHRRWQDQNRRRLELIAKKQQTPLTPDEQEEFSRLQELVSEYADPLDRELRRMVIELQHELLDSY
jgi:hypothetical protein